MSTPASRARILRQLADHMSGTDAASAQRFMYKLADEFVSVSEVASRLSAEVVDTRLALGRIGVDLKDGETTTDGVRKLVDATRVRCQSVVLRHTGIPLDALRRGTGVRDRIVVLREEINAALDKEVRS